MDNLNDVSVTPENTAAVGTESTTDVAETVNQLSDAESTVSTSESTIDESSEQSSEESPDLLKQLEEASVETTSDDNTIKHLRKLIKTRLDNVRPEQSESSEDDKYAIELYKGLTAFDNVSMKTTAEPFARTLVNKDPQLAMDAAEAILMQARPGDANGWTNAHYFLQNIGIDPTRLDEVYQYLKGEIEAPASMAVTPTSVPAEFQDAFKSYSPEVRATIEYQLDLDEGERRVALELLADRQYVLNRNAAEERGRQEFAQVQEQEIATAITSETTNVFSDFIDKLAETPTYKSVQLSANPLVDNAIKQAVNTMIINLAEPDTVVGRQALSYFKGLGVEINSSQISEYIGMINGAIETSIRAGKANATAAKSRADSDRNNGLQRLQGFRNNIFAKSIQKIAELQSGAGQTMPTGGMPTFNGTPTSNGAQGKPTTLELIENLTRQAQMKRN